MVPTFLRSPALRSCRFLALSARRPLRARRFEDAVLAVLLLGLVVGSLCGAPPTPGRSLADLEASGEAAWQRAYRYYEGSFKTWGRLAEDARGLGDRTARQRALRARAELAVLMRFPRKLAVLRRELTEDSDGDLARGLRLLASRGEVPLRFGTGRHRSVPDGSVPDGSVPDGSVPNGSVPNGSVPNGSGAGEAVESPTGAELGKLLERLKSAERKVARGTLYRREMLLLREIVAVVERWRGDVDQREADDWFEAALGVIRGSATEVPPASVPLEVSLLYRLRRFGAAREILVERADAIRALPAPARVAVLRTRRELARFDGDTDSVLAAEREIGRLGAVAGEPARPGASFPSFVRGSAVDLAHTLRTLLAMLAHQRPSPEEGALAAYVASLAALELGEWALAADVLTAWRAPESGWLAIAAQARLAVVRGELGDYQGALPALSAARRLLSETVPAGDPGRAAFEARLALNEAHAQLGLGQLDAVRAAAQSVFGLTDAPDLRLRARMLLVSALYEEARERPELLTDVHAAFESARRELKTWKSETPERLSLEVQLAINLGNVLRDRARAIDDGLLSAGGDVPAALRAQAIALQDSALRRADEGKLYRLAAVAAGNLGELHLEQGDEVTARSFVDWALGWAGELGLYETEWRCHWYRARLAVAAGDFDDADAHYGRATDLVESYRARVYGLEAKSGFLTDKLALYRDVVAHELRRDRVARAFAYAERAKGRALVESLGWRHVPFSRDSDASTYRELVDLLARDSMARDSMARNSLAGGAARRGVHQPGFFGVRAQAANDQELRARLETLRVSLRARGDLDPALASLLGVAEKTVPLGSLPLATTLVEYFWLGERFVAFLARRDSVEWVALNVGRRDLERDVRRFVRGGCDDGALARSLYDALLRPFASRLKDRRLIIVPYGSLHQLPFETLRDGERFVLESRDVSYLPAASALRYIARKRDEVATGAELLAVVDPDTDYDRDGRPDLPLLPGARSELAGLRSVFERREELVGPAAAESACIARARGRAVVHFACHGEFYPARPWDSALFLTPGADVGERSRSGRARPPAAGRNDGRLTALEVFGMDLARTRLVTLSGCETGRMDVLPADDTISIGTAFLHAGAASLLASLWKVEDGATSALMQGFYRHWREGGKDKVEALRAAKMELLRGGFGKPHQWGAFVLLGEP